MVRMRGSMALWFRRGSRIPDHGVQAAEAACSNAGDGGDALRDVDGARGAAALAGNAASQRSKQRAQFRRGSAVVRSSLWQASVCGLSRVVGSSPPPADPGSVYWGFPPIPALIVSIGTAIDMVERGCLC